MHRWINLLRQHTGLLLALISLLLLPVITGLLTTWLEVIYGQTPINLIWLAAGVVAVAVFLWALTIVLRERSEPLVLVPRDARPPRCPGLIALVGRGRPGEKSEPLAQAAAKAIEYHLGEDGTLKVCWLVASSGAEGSVVMARAIRQAFNGQCDIHVREAGNAFSVQDTYDVVQEIYNAEIYGEEFQDLGLDPENVIADFTSGTAPMTAGMVLACGRHRPMQYTTGRGPIRSIPLLVKFKPTPRRKRQA